MTLLDFDLRTIVQSTACLMGSVLIATGCYLTFGRLHHASKLNGVSATSWRDIVLTEFRTLTIFFELPLWISYLALTGLSSCTIAMLIISMLLRLTRVVYDANLADPLQRGMNSMRLELARWVIVCGMSVFVHPHGVALIYLS